MKLAFPVTPTLQSVLKRNMELPLKNICSLKNKVLYQKCWFHSPNSLILILVTHRCCGKWVFATMCCMIFLKGLATTHNATHRCFRTPACPPMRHIIVSCLRAMCLKIYFLFLYLPWFFERTPIWPHNRLSVRHIRNYIVNFVLIIDEFVFKQFCFVFIIGNFSPFQAFHLK